MSAFSLRPALTTDAGRVAEILSAFIDDTPWMPRVHTRAEDLSFAGEMIERGWVTVADAVIEDVAEVAGFIAREGEIIHALYVDVVALGSGCGSALVRLMKARSAALSLWTFQANARARPFYRAHGFAETERSDRAENDEGLPDIRFEWQRRR